MLTYEQHLLMLRDCLSALNTIPNQRLRHPRYETSYDLAAELSRHIRLYEAEVSDIATSR